jgi:hypothetical protein
MSGFVFCSYADSRYADRLLALILSIGKYHHGSRIVVLALDSGIKGLISKAIPRIPIEWIDLVDLDKDHENMGEVRRTRHTWDGNLTARCFFVRDVVLSENKGNIVVCLDSDTFLFASLNCIKEDFRGYNIGVTPHRFSAKVKSSRQYGLYNAGVLLFRKSSESIVCLNEWCADCLASCSSELTETTYADQKYLDKWPDKFVSLKSINSYGVNAAPWNMEDLLLAHGENNVFLNHDILTIYHFHNLREIVDGVFYHGMSMYKSSLSSYAREYIYNPYLKTLSNARKLLNVSYNITLLPFQEGMNLQRMAYDSKTWALNQIISLLDQSMDELSLLKSIENKQEVSFRHPFSTSQQIFEYIKNLLK